MPELNAAYDLALSARWVIPVNTARDILLDHTVLIRDARIVDIIPTADFKPQDAREHHNLKDHALLPGLINVHGHAAMSLFRGMADDKPLHTWLTEHIWPAEGQWVSADFVRDGTELAIAEMLRAGTTCFSDMYFFPNMAAAAAESAGMRAQLAFPIFDFPTIWANDPDEYIRKGLQLRDDYKHSDLLSFAFGPHAPYTVGDAAFTHIATLANELDAPIQVHLHETQQEVDDAVSASGERPIARLDRLGLLTPRTQCVHKTTLNDDDIERLVRSGSHVIHCPISNLKLASGFCPVQTLIDAGVNVAIGTDGAASNNDLDLFGEVRSAALLAKAIAQNAAAVSAWQALEMATINGAKALGLDADIGSLENGKLADIIAVDLSALEQQPLYDPVSTLIYTNVTSHIRHSWINGKQVLADRQPVHLDLNKLRDKAQQWQQKISAKA
jgi:5-methylthioadenosine/S-adenosylhomocysteine deaminase